MSALIALVLLAHFHLIGFVITLCIGGFLVCTAFAVVSALLNALGGWSIVIGFALLAVALAVHMRPDEIVGAVSVGVPVAALVGFILWTTRRSASPAQEPPAS
jgi:hypothetical protein